MCHQAFLNDDRSFARLDATLLSSLIGNDRLFLGATLRHTCAGNVCYVDVTASIFFINFLRLGRYQVGKQKCRVFVSIE